MFDNRMRNLSVRQIQILKYATLALSVICLLLILKPYNKAYRNCTNDDYAFWDQSVDSTSYAVNYGGVVDLESVGPASQVELQVRETGKYRFKLNSTEPVDIDVFYNGYTRDSITLSQKDDYSIRLRENDFIRFRVNDVIGKTTTTIKLEQRQLLTQLSIYLFHLMWICLFVLLVNHASFQSLVYTSIWLLTAVYAEHLYEFQSWFVPMMGMAALSYVIAYVPGFFTRIGYWFGLIGDYLIIGLTLVNLLFVANFKLYGFRMDEATIVALLQSNIKESLEFAISNHTLLFWFTVIALLLFPVGLRYVVHDDVKPKFRSGFTLLILVCGMQASQMFTTSHAFNVLINTYGDYYEQLQKFNEVQARFKTTNAIEATKEEVGETYIFVIGESQSKEHMSLYGYHRNTTPFLDSLNKEGELAVYQNVYSCHTHTIEVLSKALTAANQYNGKKYTTEPSIINVMNAAGFETVWLSNQVKLSNWDNVVSAIAEGCDRSIFINKNIGETVSGSPYDENLLPELRELLEEPVKTNRAIFVHLMGNHGAYNERYPSNFTWGEVGNLGKAYYGANKNLDEWEAYDRSIRYNDSVVYEIIRAADESCDNVFVHYMADHGEDLQEGRGHNAGLFTWRMTQIPFFVWCDSAWHSPHKRDFDSWYNQNSTFTNDLLFDWMLRYTGLGVNGQTEEGDFFKFLNHDSLLVAGRKLYGADNPYRSRLIKNDTGTWSYGSKFSVGVHRVNSLGKLNDVLSGDQFSYVELDVTIIDNQIAVGHGEDVVMSGLTLLEYTEATDFEKVKRLWIDVKNLSEDNAEVLFTGLSAIDSISKSDIIVESSNPKAYRVLNRLAQEGYAACFYMPTSLISESEAVQDAQIRRLTEKMKASGIEHLSFDSGLYPAMKRNENRMQGISWHTWNTNYDIRRGDFWDTFLEEDFVKDNRVKSVLVTYSSVFDL